MCGLFVGGRKEIAPICLLPDADLLRNVPGEGFFSVCEGTVVGGNERRSYKMIMQMQYMVSNALENLRFPCPTPQPFFSPLCLRDGAVKYCIMSVPLIDFFPSLFSQ